jgi:hypothetical protein
LATTNGHIYSSLMSISKQTGVLFAANGEVLVSVMSISEKTKSLLQQMVMF